MSETLTTRHIYALTLLGDPSLIPFFGIPVQQDVSYEIIDGTSPLFIISTTPYAYYAVKDDNGALLGAGFTDETGSGMLQVTEINTDHIDLIVTAKNKIPYFAQISITDVEDNIISEVINLQNYPNPFNPETTITFNLTTNETTDVKLEIYNLKGQKIRTLSFSPSQLPSVSATWNGRDINGQESPGGIYYLKLETNNSIIVRKILLLK